MSCLILREGYPMMQNRRAKRDDYKPSAVRVTQRCVP
ncbi:hypothetical protein PsalN5692_01744 [Piscirickettsia salmonis]|nr:hypothetical protein PsalN5692_01744 [Piscirickettsia salmonis]